MTVDPSTTPPPVDPAVYRILDASLNRAGEGLRTVEDYARFVLDDRCLTQLAKQLRHDLTAATAEIPRRYLLSARDTGGDVGTQIQTAAEQQRASLSAVAIAAVVRSQQALRSIEEHLKCVHPHLAPRVEAIRYQSYTLAAALEARAQDAQRLADARLYVLIDGADSCESLAARVAAFIDAGADVLQLRDKGLADRTLYERAVVAVAAARDPARSRRSLLIINDRVDIALAVGADGVHVGQQELPIQTVRRLLGPDRIIGVSTHNLAQAEQAQLSGADYIGCGPTFASRTKNFTCFAGLEFLQQVAAGVTLPAFAIGGIDASNLDQVLATGIRRIAVSAAVCQAASPTAAIGELKKKLRT